MKMRDRTALLVSATLCLGTSIAQAATFTVTRTDDTYDGICDADCSLRDAISAANATVGSHRIVLPANTYQLTRPAEDVGEGDRQDEDENFSGDLDVKSTLTIIGAGAQQTIITTNGSRDRLFEVFEGASLTLENLRLTGGRTSDFGGAVENHGNLVIKRVELVRNFASASFRPGIGGALANYGTAKVYYATFSDNVASAGEGSSGRGGAIYNTGDLLVRDSSFNGNWSSDDDDREVGGALYNSGTADIGRSTFAGNRARYGAALINDGQMSLFNSTVSGNEIYGDFDGAAVYNRTTPAAQPSLKLTNVTIANHPTGPGLVNLGNVLVRNSIIAGNDSNSEGHEDCINRGSGIFRAKGLLLSNAGSCTGEVHVDPASVFTQVLYNLAQNNGQTRTHALRKGSPALDAAIGNCPATDQRGLKRPRDGNGDGLAVCDLGAYERAYP